jgi:hypothetical protein
LLPATSIVAIKTKTTSAIESSTIVMSLKDGGYNGDDYVC